MPGWRPPSDHDAAKRARAWLNRQHAQARAQVLQLLDEAPTEAISQALDSLSTAELRALQRTSPAPPNSGAISPTALLTACDQRGGGAGGGSLLPRLVGQPACPGADGAGGAAMPGGQARMSGIPPPRRSKRPSHSCLTACPTTRRPLAVAGRDAPSARAASLASSAAQPVSPCPPLAGRLDPNVIPYVNLYVIPYAQGWRTPGLGT
jgi:hypothetical protein